MIVFNSFTFTDSNKIRIWLKDIIYEEGFSCGDLHFNFCTDSELLEINKKYLLHDTFTDIITFDYTVKSIISGEIYISLEMANYNSKRYKVSFISEIYRLLSHGILHLCGYNDFTDEEKALMRLKESYYINKIS